jgi:archaellum component FlaF (FlaF/FlaG flagellin family)
MRTSIWVVGALVLCTSTAFAGDNPRVYVTDSASWEVGSGGVAVDATGASRGSGGARPQTAEIIKTFNQRCPNVIITSRKEKADYIVLLDHEGGKDAISRDNKIAIFNNGSGDAIFSRSTRSLGNAVKDACPVIYHDFSRRAAAAESNKQVEASVSENADQTLVANNSSRKVASLHVTSSPAGADILVDGKFVGSTPSTLQLAPGDHTINVQKNGFSAWNRIVHVVPGDVNVVAELIAAR